MVQRCRNVAVHGVGRRGVAAWGAGGCRVQGAGVWRCRVWVAEIRSLGVRSIVVQVEHLAMQIP